MPKDEEQQLHAAANNGDTGAQLEREQAYEEGHLPRTLNDSAAVEADGFDY